MDITKFKIEKDGSMYRDSKHGRFRIDVKDLCILGKGVCLEYKKNKRGYIRIDLYKSDKRIGTIGGCIMQPIKGFVVDHINHDTLDNRRLNLRIVSCHQNCMNRRKATDKNYTSKFKGVSFLPVYKGKKFPKPFRAFGKINGVKKSLGYFSTEEEAAKAYNTFASSTYGEFAMLNTIGGGFRFSLATAIEYPF